MTTTTRPTPQRSAVFSLDPYLIDDCTFTRGEILRARQMTPRRRAPRRPRSSRPAQRSGPAPDRSAA